MATRKKRDGGRNEQEPATDPRAAALQNEVRENRDALRESAQRVEASVSGDATKRIDRPIGSPAPHEAATDPVAAAMQDEVRANHDALEESARRVEASVSPEVRNTPVQPASESRTSDDAESLRLIDEARENANAARDGARRVRESTEESRNRDRNH